MLTLVYMVLHMPTFSIAMQLQTKSIAVKNFFQNGIRVCFKLNTPVLYTVWAAMCEKIEYFQATFRAVIKEFDIFLTNNWCNNKRKNTNTHDEKFEHDWLLPMSIHECRRLDSFANAEAPVMEGARGACAPQVLGYQLTLFGPRGADHARHITTGPPKFLDDGASLE